MPVPRFAIFWVITASLEPIAYKIKTQNELQKCFHILFKTHAYIFLRIMTSAS